MTRQQFSQRLGRLFPKRTGPPFITLAVQVHAWGGLKLQVFHAEVGHLLHARAGVVEEQKQCSVPLRRPTGGREGSEQSLNFIPIEKAGFGRRNALRGDGGDAFGFLEPFRHPVNDIFKECAQGSQPLIACSNVIVSLSL
jgi:hypothetical protein